MVRHPRRFAPLMVGGAKGHWISPKKDIMNKHLWATLLAVPLALVSQEQASAWFKFNTGVGGNIGWQSGGSKDFMWGLCRSNDTPLVGGKWDGIPPGGAPGSEYTNGLYGVPGAGGMAGAPLTAGGFPGGQPGGFYGAPGIAQYPGAGQFQGANQFNPTMGQFGNPPPGAGGSPYGYPGPDPFYNFGSIGQDFSYGWMSPMTAAPQYAPPVGQPNFQSKPVYYQPYPYPYGDPTSRPVGYYRNPGYGY